MHLTKTVLALVSSSQLAWTIAIDREPLLEERKALAGCPDGGYLLGSTPAGPYCITALGLGLAASIIAPTAAVIISSAKAVWTSNQPVAVSADIPAPSKKRSALPMLESRDATVTSYHVEGVAGYDSHDPNNPNTDNDWAQIVTSMIDYMNQDQIECLAAIVYGDATNYEDKITVWLATTDGADHRSC